MWSNFHMHSKYCDGKGELKDYIEQARSLQMISVGFSSHAPVNFACKWCMHAENLGDYLQEVEMLKSSIPEIDIYKSLEIDFIPGRISPAQFKDRLDYTVGSIHFVDEWPDGTPWEIDGQHSLFLEGLEKNFKGDIRLAITRYFELTREMVQTAEPTIVGHLDKIKIQNPSNKFFTENDPWYQSEVKRTIDVIHKSNCIVEVNTRGIYQKKTTDTYPSPWILKILHEKNIPITLSSDAHHPSDIINHFAETAVLLSDIGFKSITVLHEGRWKPFSFNAHGIIF